LEAQHRDAVRNSLSSEVLQHYKEIEDAFASGNANALKGAVIARSQQFLDAYIEDHPEQADAIKPLQELAELVEFVGYRHRNSSLNPAVDREVNNILNAMVSSSRNKEGGLVFLEDAVDNIAYSVAARKWINDTLSSLQMIGYIRDATIVKAKEERLKAQAEQEKKDREAKKKAEEAKSKAIEDARKAAEEKKKAAEEAKKKEEEKKEGLPTEEELGKPLWETGKKKDSKKEEEEKKAKSKEEIAESVYKQVVEQLSKLGIVVHNKAEMEAFLKENGIEDV